MAENIRTTEVSAIVNIDGNKVPFISLKIAQEMGEHHDFEVLVDYKTIDEKYHGSPEMFLKQTNTKVVIDLWHADKPEHTYVFSGKVTQVKILSSEGPHGGILYIGKSNTIEMERGEITQSYSNTNLQEILQTITGGTINLSTQLFDIWKSDIDFILQYKESDWDFLKKICYIFQERFFYSGSDLMIGKHPEFKTINLTYDKELITFDVCSRLLPNQFSTYYYKREEDTVWEQDSPASIENATNLLNTVSNRSDMLTVSRKPNAPTPAYVPDMAALIEHTKRRKVSEGAKMMYVSCQCKTCDVRIGRLVNISMPPKLGGANMGTYRVYKVIHQLDQSGNYTSFFEAHPADLEYIPAPKVFVPTPSSFEAIVWDNVDPEGQGRVRVGFEFDERPCETWIPVMSFDAGTEAKGSGNVAVNRGAIFLPEKGDRCILGFLDGQILSQPYIMGNMFHGKITDNQGGGNGNFIKTIITKSGHTIKFDDTDNKEKIQIFDKKKNLIQIDTASDTIDIVANSTINMQAININLLAKNAITATAGVNFSANAGVSSTIIGGVSSYINAGKEVAIKAGKTLSAKGGKSALVSSGMNAQMSLDSKGNTTIQGKKKVEVKSKQRVKIAGDKQTLVQSKDMKIQGKTKTSIKGNKVHVG